MQKGKTKRPGKKFSVMWIPHSSGNNKTFTVSIWQIAVFFCALIAAVWWIAGTFHRVSQLKNVNASLQSSLDTALTANRELTGLLAQQTGVLQNTSRQLNTAIAAKEGYTDVVDQFNEKYNSLLGTYVNQKVSTAAANIKSSHTKRTFVQDMTDLKGILTEIDQLSALQPSQNQEMEKVQNKIKTYMDTLPTLWPVSGSISSRYGKRLHPILFIRKKHEGIDINANTGVNIKAAASGKVLSAQYTSGYGKCVVLSHGNGVTTVYGHASKLLVKKGDTVHKGEVIAKVGSTGLSTGPHLHFEVRLNGNAVDPLQHLE